MKKMNTIVIMIKMQSTESASLFESVTNMLQLINCDPWIKTDQCSSVSIVF